jgi:hypothetical protein
VVRSRLTLQIRCVIFESINSPLAFVEYAVQGILVPELDAGALLDQVRSSVKGPKR